MSNYGIPATIVVGVLACCRCIAADLVIDNIRVVAISSGSVSAPTRVSIEDGLITGIAPSGPAQGDMVVDGSGRFLIPGLIDSHTHLGEIPGMTYQHEREFPEVAEAGWQQIPLSYLYHGFTTVIDLNSVPERISRWNQAHRRPQAYFCGGAPIVDGYPMRFTPPPLRYEITPYFLLDESHPEDFPDGVDPENHTPSSIVERISRDGGICIKTHYESGFGGRGDWPVPEVELIRDLVVAAREHGLPVLLHANSQDAQSFGIAAGVSAFAHGMWTWNDRSGIKLTPEVKTIVDATIEHGIFLQPTVQVLFGERDLHDPDYLNSAALRQVVPANLRRWYATDAGQYWRNDMANIPHVAKLLSENRWEDIDAEPIARVADVLDYFSAAGGRLLFGSDTPSDLTYANPPGLNGRLEMDKWIAAGVSPVQLLRAATVENARFFGLDDIGSIDIGKRADLLILRENPLENVTAYDSIEYVILGGEVIERAALQAQ